MRRQGEGGGGRITMEEGKVQDFVIGTGLDGDLLRLQGLS